MLQWASYVNDMDYIDDVDVKKLRDSIECFHAWWPRPKPNTIHIDISGHQRSVACIQTNGSLALNINHIRQEIESPNWLPFLPTRLRSSKLDLFTILSHEFVHLEQIATGQMVLLQHNLCIWEGIHHRIAQTYMEYSPNSHLVPWEKDAYELMGPLADQFRKDTDYRCPITRESTS